MTIAVDNIPEQKLADKTLKGVLSTKFGNQLTESELVEMENSLFDYRQSIGKMGGKFDHIYCLGDIHGRIPIILESLKEGKTILKEEYENKEKINKRKVYI